MHFDLLCEWQADLQKDHHQLVHREYGYPGRWDRAVRR